MESKAMDKYVIMQVFKTMDNLGITERGVDKDGDPYFPYVILDEHISRIGGILLRYVNDPNTH